MYLASLLAIVASTALTVGLYYMKRQAERLPSLGGGWRVAAWWAFVRDPWWMVGLALQIVGFALYMVALRAGPLSIVHTALNGGIALFVVLAVVGLGEDVRPVEWIGVSAITIALIALGISLAENPGGRAEPHDMLPFSVALVAFSVIALASDRTPRRAIGLSIASGVTLGLGSVYAKSLADAPSVAAALTSVYLLLTLATHVVGFAWMQASFQAGRGAIVIPLSSALSNLVPIAGGLLLFDEWLPGNEVAAALRSVSFALAIGGAAVLAGFGQRAEIGQVGEVNPR